MAEGSDPLFVNWRTGIPIPITGDLIPDGSITTAKLADGAATTAKIADYAVTLAKLSGLIVPPQGRLTLQTNTPVMITDNVSKNELFYAPKNGLLLPLWDGSKHILINTGGQLSQLTTDTTKSPAAVAANSVYDIYGWLDGSTPRATRSPAWVSDVSRGAGAGTAEQDYNTNIGFLTNKFNITNGPAANRGHFLGTVRSDASSLLNWKLGGAAAGGSAAILGVWNNYNRILHQAQVSDSTGSWTYNSDILRQRNASVNNLVSFISGLAEDSFDVFNGQGAVGSSVSVEQASIYVGFDSLTTRSGSNGFSNDSVTGFISFSFARYTAKTLGYHFVAPLESTLSGTGNNVTFYGSTQPRVQANTFTLGFMM